MTTILGEPAVTDPVAQCWAASKGAPFYWCDLARLYWPLAQGAGVRPDVAWVQACKETNFGRFGRAVTKEHRNVCGSKIPDASALPDDSPNAHQRFPTWQAGIQAQLDHLALYAGAPGYPRDYVRKSATQWVGDTWDPRHFPLLWGKAANSVEALGGPGMWAPAANYGQTIVTSLEEMIKYGWS